MACYSDMLKSFTWSVYIVEERDFDGTPSGLIKIGSARCPKYRLSSLVSGNPRPIALRYEHDLKERRIALMVERGAHELLTEVRIKDREWFRCDFATAQQAVEACIVRAKSVPRGSASHEYRLPA